MQDWQQRKGKESALITITNVYFPEQKGAIN